MITLILLLQLAGNSPADSIASVLEDQQAAWNSGDIEQYMEGYWKSDSLVFTSGGSINRGWQATFQKYQRTYDTPGKMGELHFSDVEITVLPGGNASVLGRWELHRDEDQPGGVFSLVFRMLPEGWRIILDHTSVDDR